MQSATQTFSNAGPTDQRATSHGSKRPLVLTTKPHSDITGQRSSLLLIPIPLALLTSHFFFCFTPLRHFLTRSVLSISPGCGVRQRKAAVQTPAIERALKANIKMPATSRVALLFFNSTGWGFQQSEENKVELQYERTEEPFPHGPLLTQISGYMQLPRILLSILRCSLSPSRVSMTNLCKNLSAISETSIKHNCKITAIPDE